jgi:Rrf2 family protein
MNGGRLAGVPQRTAGLDPNPYPADRQSTMLSQKTRYAIRAMQHLADHYGEGPVQLAAIAGAQKIPAKFLTVILSELARAGLVESLRGRDGGYWLAIPPLDITYGDLIRHMRGSLALVPCASRYAHEKCKNCLEEGECRTRALMLDVRDRTAQILDTIRLSDPITPVPPFDGDTV